MTFRLPGSSHVRLSWPQPYRPSHLPSAGSKAKLPRGAASRPQPPTERRSELHEWLAGIIDAIRHARSGH